MRALDVATAPRPDTRHWKQSTVTWDELVEWARNPASRKACGNYLLGRLGPTSVDHPSGPKGCTSLHRTKAAVVSRSGLTLDADNARPGLPDQVELVLGCRAIVHPTYSSRPDKPRYRVLLPTDRDMTPDEYRRAAAVVMRQLGEEQFDQGSTQPERYMFRPATQDPDGYEARVVEGEPLSVDALLAEYVEPTPAAAPDPAPAAAVPVSGDYVRAAVAGALRDLDELADLPEGARDVRGRGWDDGVFEAACQLVRAANSGHGPDDARVAFTAHAPAATGTYDPDHKWASAVEAVGASALTPQGRPGDDFGRVVPARAAAGPQDGSVDRSTWAGVDLTGYLDGSHQPPVPRFLVRSDGVALLYPGLTHSIHGEPESGKSMVVQHEAVQVIMAGAFVLYADFESDPGSIVERLLDLGASRAAVAERFVYIQPATDPDRYAPDHAAFLATLDAHPYALAVIDGVSESMDVVTGDGKDPNATAIEWARKVPRRIADRTGAAVVQIDHVTKNADSRGRFAIGGQAKLSALTGAAYSIDVCEPLGRGLRGELVLRVAKDRPGYVRGRSGAHRPSDRTQEAARVIVDSTGDVLIVSVVPPPTGATGDSAQTLLMERVSQILAKLPEGHPGASGNLVRASVKGKNDSIDEALKALVELGYVTRTFKGQSQLHRLRTAFVPDFEEAGDE